MIVGIAEVSSIGDHDGRIPEIPKRFQRRNVPGSQNTDRVLGRLPRDAIADFVVGVLVQTSF